jgi:hypothetical protein
VIGSNWRTVVFWSSYVLLAACLSIRMAYELLKPMLWFLLPGGFFMICAWLYWQWRRRERDWY